VETNHKKSLDAVIDIRSTVTDLKKNEISASDIEPTVSAGQVHYTLLIDSARVKNSLASRLQLIRSMVANMHCVRSAY